MGIRICRRFLKLWKLVRPRTRPPSYARLEDDEEGSLQAKKQKRKTLRTGLRFIRKSLFCCSASWYREERAPEKKAMKGETFSEVTPKGHLVVYVGEEGDQQRRFVVPVIYFNHPLFGQLLKESVEEYGFSQPGGITIPCHVSYFKSVQERIAGERFSGKWRTRGRRRWAAIG
ncbi:Auxin-responsive protein [Nymphaea thermarum]|nr:Auxin-responsive protein [Nymphaea thermarum]